jgi:hypothetical protein
VDKIIWFSIVIALVPLLPDARAETVTISIGAEFVQMVSIESFTTEEFVFLPDDLNEAGYCFKDELQDEDIIICV